ncbi:DNA repair photolyase [Natronincola peptidivorans]|uniref:DNA repair photolyase n=1 Tax=Natronincola peptidivorans TaxID=426128 RepID=A0A1I0DP74_9FIRM|nr:radical SAM protein [Natronincola peptidivorans]SET33927.1 DNA repair photolyase [Natronincola peptidivorans]
MEYIPAKTIVTKTKNSQWFGSDYNMNIYKGCCHGCIYCDSRSECYRIDNFDQVRAKEKAIEIIRRELQSKRKKGVIATGAMSDPYNPFEKQLQLTRQALEHINTFGFGVSIATKSHLIIRDKDVLSRIKQHSPVLVKITITTCDDQLCKKIEPNVSISSERFLAVKELSQQDIFTGILLMPVLPFLQDNEKNISGIIRLAHESGARFIYPAFGVTLRQNQREWYFQKLDQLFPGIKNQYIKQYGNSYQCTSKKARALWTLFERECQRLGILYRMKDIIKGYKEGYGSKQLSFF